MSQLFNAARLYPGDSFAFLYILHFPTTIRISVLASHPGIDFLCFLKISCHFVDLPANQLEMDVQITTLLLLQRTTCRNNGQPGFGPKLRRVCSE